MQKQTFRMVLATVTVLAAMVMFQSCSTVSRAAARYWTNRQIKEFTGTCEEKSSLLLGNDNAKKYCDCAVDIVAEKYRDYEAVKKLSLTDVLKVARDCK